MLRNTWKEVENTDDDDDFEDTIWYYFQSSGKAYKNAKKSINGQTYIFDNEGKMLFGWINDRESGGDYEMADKDEDTDSWKEAVYYAGEANDGALVISNWKQIRVHDDQPALKVDGDDDDYDYWFYFGSNGKKYYADSDDEKGYAEKTIGGKKYAFTENGNMAYEWVDEASEASDGVKYFSSAEDGARRTKAWFKVVPSEAIDDEDYEGGNDDAHWFYAINTGELARSEVRSINGKKYLFDDNGELLAGLRWVEFSADGKDVTGIGVDLTKDKYTEDDLDDFTTVKAGEEDYPDDGTKTGMYYFAKPIDDDASMKTGSCSITIDGDSYAFKFESSGAHKGKGINGLDGNSYYVNGRKVTADSDNKFEIYECTIGANKKVSMLRGDTLTADDLVNDYVESDGKIYGSYAVVTTSGSIVKSGTKKDGDDYKITVSGYTINKIKSSDDYEWTVIAE